MDEAIKNFVHRIIELRDQISSSKIIDPNDDYWIGTRKTYNLVLIELNSELERQGLSLEPYWPPNKSLNLTAEAGSNSNLENENIYK